MQSASASECFDHINAYFGGKRTGHLLLVNTENYNIYQEILVRLQADTSKKCICASQHVASNGLSDVDAVISAGCKNEDSFILGVSQILMLRGADALEMKVDELLELSISGYCVVLLDHCEQVLRKFMSRDIRNEKKVVLVDGEPSTLPHIKLAPTQEVCIGVPLLKSFAELLEYLETITNEKNQQNPEVTILSTLPISLFRNSIYPVSAAADVYDALVKKYPDIGGATERSYGTDEQWSWLAAQMQNFSNFAAFVCSVFGTTANLSMHLSEVSEEGDKNKEWMLWLSLMTYGEQNNYYISHVLKNTKMYTDFKKQLYFDIIEISMNDPNFERMLSERKHLLRQLPESLPLINQYCDKLGRLQKDAVFYLSDDSDREKYEFISCLSSYDYSQEELQRAVSMMSKSLAQYMQDFEFDTLNTKVSESDAPFRSELTMYFRQYKRQKLTNRIYPEFLETVNKYALSPRPYNKLQPRSSIISHMDRKNTKLFFFDALGVEYLAFILAKCEEYGLVSEISIGHCELPSITEKNKEFLQFYADENWYKIDELDDLKHGNQIYDYEKCKLPIHLFEELEVIDGELRKIQSQLVQGTIERAVVVADHGASRLAVLYGQDVSASLILDESGEHSGRCCLADQDPRIPCAAYEDGYSILANYERFKGGRKANVEVHGGASLEEVLVPIIVLSKKPDNLEICFVDATVELVPRVIPELTLYSNVPLQKPRICVNGRFYESKFIVDKKHVKFSLPEIKRKGTYSADIYDGEKNLSITLEFKLVKKTKEQELF